MFTILLNVFECKEVTTCMIKYTVKDNLNSFFVTDCYEIFEIFVSSRFSPYFWYIPSVSFKMW